MATKTKTIYKPGNVTDLYEPGGELYMKWHVKWVIISSRYDLNRNQTAIKLVSPDHYNAYLKAQEAKKRVENLKFQEMIRYSDEGAYSRKELTLSADAKDSLFYSIRMHNRDFNTKVTDILVLGKWPEPWPRKESKLYLPTWRIYVTYQDKSGKKYFREIHINKKAIY